MANVLKINLKPHDIVKKNNLNLLKKDSKVVYSSNNSISLVFQDNSILMGVVGELDSNIKETQLVEARKKVVDKYDWKFVANQHYTEVYMPLVNNK